MTNKKSNVIGTGVALAIGATLFLSGCARSMQAEPIPSSIEAVDDGVTATAVQGVDVDEVVNGEVSAEDSAALVVIESDYSRSLNGIDLITGDSQGNGFIGTLGDVLVYHVGDIFAWVDDDWNERVRVGARMTLSGDENSVEAVRAAFINASGEVCRLDFRTSRTFTGFTGPNLDGPLGEVTSHRFTADQVSFGPNGELLGTLQTQDFGCMPEFEPEVLMVENAISGDQIFFRPATGWWGTRGLDDAAIARAIQITIQNERDYNEKCICK
jgi:hypothetical protein